MAFLESDLTIERKGRKGRKKDSVSYSDTLLPTGADAEQRPDLPGIARLGTNRLLKNAA